MDSDLLLRHQRFLRGLVRGLVGDGPTADDLEQDTWLAALERPPRSEGGLPAWLARVAHNLNHNRRRSEASEAARRSRSGGERCWPSAAEVAAELELADCVLAEVRALPESLRTAVHARYYDGLALAEIARRSGVPAETIKDRLERARALLRSRLGRDLGPERRPGLVLALLRALASFAGGILVRKLVVLVVLALVATFAVRSLGTRPERGLDPPAPALSVAAAAVTSDLERPSPGPLAENTARASIPSEELAPAALPAERGSLLATVTWPDGTPAEHVFVRVSGSEEADPVRFYRGAETGADGRCRFERLVPGGYRVQMEREEDPVPATVRAGEETLLELVVSAGPRVTGEVVDWNGEPVAGAHVWIATRYPSWDGPPIDDAPAAVTGADGRFEIRSAGKAWLIGARAEGHAPSEEKSLTRFRSPEVEVRLVLPEEGGAIEGRVVDPDGVPVEGAIVRADVGFRFEGDREQGMVIRNSLRVQTRSDPEGAFRIGGVQPGEVELAIDSDAYAGWHAKVEVSAEATTRVEARLDPPGAVSGRVLTPDGTPIAGARVLASLQSTPQRLVPQADWLDQSWSPLLRSPGAFTATRSGSDGSYRLSGLAAGWSWVMAESEGAGRGVQTFALGAGGEVEADLVLARGLELRCRLVDENGAPLAGLAVFVGRTADAAHGVAYEGARGPYRTDADGRFVAPSCVDADYQLDIRHPRHDERSLESPDARGLRPGPSENQVVVLCEELSEAGLHGIVLDDGGQPLARARVDLVYPNGSSDRIADSGADGGFRAEGLAPGTFELRIRAPGFPCAVIAPCELLPGETLELGVVQLVTPGLLEVSLQRADGQPVIDEHWRVDLYEPDGITYVWARFEVELGVARSDPLAPGDYLLRVPGLADRPVHVEAGVTGHLDVVQPTTAPK